jgi:DNA repair protein RadC
VYTKDQTQLRHSFLSYLLLRHSQLKISYSEKLLSPPISSPRESYAFFRSIWDKQLINVQEQAYILYLNNGNEVICWRCLNTGTGNQSLFDVKLALACGLACLATNIIIAHNQEVKQRRRSNGD